MRRARGLSLLLLSCGLTACGEHQPPTAPQSDLGPGGPAYSLAAGHRVVNSLADPGNGTCNATQCTLREAIEDPGSTDISFASGLTGPITLAPSGAGGGRLSIDKDLSVTGPSNGIVIRRRSTDPEFRIFRIGPATVTLKNLSARGGKADHGGGIINFGTLRLVHCTVADNETGGIDNHGRLTLTNSVVAGNTGPGIDNHSDFALTFIGGTVARNSGAGIVNRGGTLTLTSGTVMGNSGGGIIQTRGTATIDKSRILSNSGGGIAMSHGNVTLKHSTVAANSSAGNGGGIANFAGNFTIATSTIANNSATGLGGGIFNTVGDPFGRLDAQLTLTNSTVSGNSAASGGGIDNSDRLGGARLRITNSTIAFNSAQDEGGGIRQAEGLENPNSVALFNSLVAKNSAPTEPDLLGSFFASFSLIGDGTGSDVTNTNGNQVGKVSPNGSRIDPQLGPLADNGGPTRTHALLVGSAALDAASTADCPAHDQRGVQRPQGPACDIGSFEREVAASQ